MSRDFAEPSLEASSALQCSWAVWHDASMNACSEDLGRELLTADLEGRPTATLPQRRHFLERVAGTGDASASFGTAATAPRPNILWQML